MESEQMYGDKGKSYVEHTLPIGVADIKGKEKTLL